MNEMGKYFGTDGARGRVNETLTLDMAVRIGRYLGWHYGKEKRARIVIGKDTRLSGYMRGVSMHLRRDAEDPRKESVSRQFHLCSLHMQELLILSIF